MRAVAVCLCSVTLLLAACGGGGQHARSSCGGHPVDLVPITDLARGEYDGYRGGLYPDGRNNPPAHYLAQGLHAAAQVRPRGPDGRPSPSGRIVLLSIGMSNAASEFGAFESVARNDPHASASVTIVDGAQNGYDAGRVGSGAGRYWSVLARRLAAAGVTPPQVQVAWLKEAIAGHSGGFPTDARRLQDDLRTILRILGSRFPELRLVYLSSRTYGGYARTALNPEPYAYDSGFAVKWLIEQRMRIRAPVPWLGWGPYLWTDGDRGRGDGFVWTCADVASDGTHPSQSGARKVARLLLRFFTTDPTARPWFVGRSS